MKPLGKICGCWLPCQNGRRCPSGALRKNESKRDSFLPSEYAMNTPPPPRAATPIRILVVEDDLEMQFLIESVLTYDPRLKIIAKTTNAIEAMALTRKMDPALIILDHLIEGEIMGLQAAPMVKAIAPKVRIIFFTVQDFSFEARQEPAIDLYLPKRDIRKLLPAAQKLIGLEPGA